MPLYEYSCSKCDTSFTRLCSVSDRNDAEKTPCPKCETCGTVHQVIGAPNISYAGTAKTTNSFNDRMKDLRNNFPKSEIAMDQIIR